MNKYEFIDRLKVALEGEVSEITINENITYYSNYIDNEVNKGKSESMVLQELGDPRLIAKTIIDTNTISKSNGTYTYSNENEEPIGKEDRKKGFSAEYDQQDGWDIRFGNIKLNTWYGKALLVILVIIILFVLGNIAIALLPVIIPIIIAFLLISYITGGRR
jgi:hypothetical protein